MGIFLSLGDAELVKTGIGYDFSECVLHNFLVEENVQALEGSIVRSHAAVVEVRNDVHALFRHILLGENGSDFTCTVIAEVHEDDSIAFLYLCERCTCSICNNYRFDELVGDICIIRRLDTFSSGGESGTFAFSEKVISLFYTCPSLVTVHCIETAADCGNLSGALCHVFLEVSHEALAAVRVCITAVHEAVYIDILQAIFFGNVQELVVMVE